MQLDIKANYGLLRAGYHIGLLLIYGQKSGKLLVSDAKKQKHLRLKLIKMLSEFRELLATSLAEKLCFRVCTLLEWVEKQKITAEQLTELHRSLHKYGVNSWFSTAILVAFVNNLSIDELWDIKNEQKRLF